MSKQNTIVSAAVAEEFAEHGAEVVTEPEDPITVELGEHLQFEEDHFLSKGKLCYYPGMRSPNRVTGEDMSQPRSPRRHAGPDTSTHAALNNTALSLNVLPPPSSDHAQHRNSNASATQGTLVPVSPRTYSQQSATRSPSTSRSNETQLAIPTPPSPRRNQPLVVATPQIKKLAAQQEVDSDPYSIRKQLQSIRPLPSLSRIMHNLPLIDDAYKTRIGLKLIQRVASEKDPAVQWRRLTALELQALKRKEAEAEETAARKLRMQVLLEEQKPKLSEHEMFMNKYDQSRRDARMQAQGEQDRIKDLERRLANTDKQLAKEKLMRDREPTTQIVHKIFDEGRQIKAAAAAATASASTASNSNNTPRGGKAPPVQLTKLPPLNDADVQARKSKYNADMQTRIAKMKEEAAALATAEEESRAELEEVIKARRALEDEKALVLKGS